MVTVHDPDYRAALQDFNTFTEKVSEKVVEADELIPELPVKDVVSNDASLILSQLTRQIYRIYRGESGRKPEDRIETNGRRRALFQRSHTIQDLLLGCMVKDWTQRSVCALLRSDTTRWR
jgi:hypothetical protein